MNVLDFYHAKHLHIAEPIELEEDHYFCRLHYNKSPLNVKTNKVCYYKNKRTPHNMYISITSKDYLEWFERFYHDIVDLFHASSKEWFEDELTRNDLECSFVNPLKANIKDNCFDIMCSIDEHRIMITDTNDNMIRIQDMNEQDVIPTFHIKGIKFNSKTFSLEIELNHLCIITETNGPSLTPIQAPEPIESSDLELSEYVVDTNTIQSADVHLDNLSIYTIYEFLNSKIKEHLIEDIRTVFTTKKIKTKLDFSEVVDDEEPDE